MPETGSLITTRTKALDWVVGVVLSYPMQVLLLGSHDCVKAYRFLLTVGLR